MKTENTYIDDEILRNYPYDGDVGLIGKHVFGYTTDVLPIWTCPVCGDGVSTIIAALTHLGEHIKTGD